LKTTTNFLTGLVKVTTSYWLPLMLFLDSHLKVHRTRLAGVSLALADVMILTVVLELCQLVSQALDHNLVLPFEITLTLAVTVLFELNS